MIESKEILNFYFRYVTTNRSILAVDIFKLRNRNNSCLSLKKRVFSNKNFSFSFVPKSNIEHLKMQSKDSLQNENLIQNLTEDGGVIKKIIKPSNGLKVEINSTVKVHYVGKLESGLVFDSSYERKEPYIFTTGENKVIKGWEIGIKSMRVGEKAQLEISSEYGYKKKGIPPIIPPNSKLIFEIELLEVSYIDINLNKITPNLELNQTGNEKVKLKNYQNSTEINQTIFEQYLKNFFFISPFRSQSGESAPWWLNPNLTFILVFLVVFILFAFVLSIGGIHQGYIEDNFNANFLK